MTDIGGGEIVEKGELEMEKRRPGPCLIWTVYNTFASWHGLECEWVDAWLVWKSDMREMNGHSCSSEISPVKGTKS